MQNYPSQPNQEPFPTSDKPFLSYDYFDDLYKATNNKALDLPKAGIGLRLLVWLVDLVPFTILCVIVWAIGSDYYQAHEPLSDGSMNIVRGEFKMLLIVIGFAIVLLITSIYVLICIACGQTLGNFITQTKYVDNRGAPPGFRKSFVRLMTQSAAISVSYGIAWLIMELGWAAFDKNKQGLFDKVVDVYLVKSSSN